MTDYTYDPDHRAADRDPDDAAQPLYDADEACVKCGQRRTVNGDGALLTWHRTEYRPEADMLVVVCGECSFTWARRPVDDQPCSGTAVVDLPADPLVQDSGKRFCSLRMGHLIPHDFRLTEDPIQNRSGLPW